MSKQNDKSILYKAQGYLNDYRELSRKYDESRNKTAKTSDTSTSQAVKLSKRGDATTKDFLSKIQSLTNKTRIISRRKSEDPGDLLDDSWLYEDEESMRIFEKNSQVVTTSAQPIYIDARSHRFPKRETARIAKTEKRTFGYQLPIKERTQEQLFEREVKRTTSPATYRRNRAPRTKTYNVYFDIVK